MRRAQSKAKILCDLCVLCGEFKLKPSGANKLKKNSMKTAIHHLITLAVLAFVPAVLFAQQVPNTFENNTVIYAEEINENFEHLQSQLQEVREFGNKAWQRAVERNRLTKATVDCTAGAVADPENRVFTSIQEARRHHSFLIIKGICEENLELIPVVPDRVLETFEQVGNYNGHSYALTPTTMTFSEAKALAEQHGGHLVTIENETENQFLTEHFALVVQSLPEYTGQGTRLWIDLVDTTGNDTWGWDTGDSANYLNWNADYGQPSNVCSAPYCVPDTEENCSVIRMNPDHLGQWHDVPCELFASWRALIEWDEELEFSPVDTALLSPFLILYGDSEDANVDGIRAADAEKPVIASGGLTWLMLKNLGIEGGSTGIDAGVRNLEIAGGRIHDNTGNGIQIKNNTSLWMHSNSRVENNGGAGIRSERNSKVGIKNSTIVSNQERGVKISESSSAWIDGSTFEDNGDNGVEVSFSSSLVLKNSTFTGHTNNQSVKITRGSSAKLEGNTITGGKGQAVGVDRGSVADLRDNTIENADGQGIAVLDSSHAILEGNTLRNNSSDGLAVGNNGSVILRGGNAFTGNSSWGITLNNGGSLEMWCGDQPDNPTTISSNSGGAFRADQGATAKLCNLNLDGAVKSIFAGMGATLNLSNVDVANSQDEGLLLWGAKAHLEDVSISNSAKAGVRVIAGKLLLKNVTLRDNTQHGIAAHGESAVEFYSGTSTISGNDTGILLNDSTLWLFEREPASVTVENNSNQEIVADRSALGLVNFTIGGTAGETEVDLRWGSVLHLYDGTTVTGTIQCGGYSQVDNASGTNATTTGC